MIATMIFPHGSPFSCRPMTNLSGSVHSRKGESLAFLLFKPLLIELVQVLHLDSFSSTVG